VTTTSRDSGAAAHDTVPIPRGPRPRANAPAPRPTAVGPTRPVTTGNTPPPRPRPSAAGPARPVAGPTADGPTRPVATGTPPVPRARLTGVDATRGVALLGMMAIHALYPYDDAGRPTVMYSLAAGRAAAVFAVLAGVGIVFLTGRRRVLLGLPGRRTAAVLAARAAVIGGIGLVLGGFADSDIAMVILPYYAVLFLIAVPLVLLPTAAVAAVGTAVVAGMPFVSHVVRARIPLPSGLNHSFADLFTDPVGMVRELLLTGEFPVLPWTTYLCAGIVVGRLRLHSSRTAAALLVSGATTAVAAVGLSAWLLGPMGGLAHIQAAGTGDADIPVTEILTFGADGTTPTTTMWWLALQAPHTGTPLDLLHTTGTAVALLGALLLLGHVTVPGLRRVIDPVLAPLAAAGSMTLTLYTAHIVFMSSPLDDFDAVPGYVLQVVTALLFAVVWRRLVGRGPLETLVTRAAHGAAAAVEGPSGRHGA